MKEAGGEGVPFRERPSQVLDDGRGSGTPLGHVGSRHPHNLFNSLARCHLGAQGGGRFTTLTAPGGRAMIPLGEPSTFYWEPTSEDVTFRYHVIGWKDNLSRDPRDVAIRRWLAGG